MEMIQTEEINPMAKNNQTLRGSLVTVLPSTPKRLGGIPRIYHQVANIQLPLAVRQGQYV